VACQILFAIIVVVVVFGVPESPRWLFSKGRDEEAVSVLCEIYGRSPDDEKIVREKTDVLNALNLERIHGEYKWSQLFKRDEVQTGRRVLLAYGMQFMNQIGGINLVVYFVPSALQYNVGLSHNLSLLIGGFVQTMFFFGSLVPTFLLDKLGRRRPMMWGCAGLALSMMMIAVLLSFSEARGYSASTTHATSSASVAFFFTVGQIGYYPTEPVADIRSTCSSSALRPIASPGFTSLRSYLFTPVPKGPHSLRVLIVSTTIQYCLESKLTLEQGSGFVLSRSIITSWYRKLTPRQNFVIVMITPTLINSLHWQAYLIFMCTNAAFVPLVFFCYPETANLTLEEVDYLFVKDGNSGLKKFTRRSEPVQASLKDDVEKGAAAMHLEHANQVEVARDDSS